MTRTEVLVDTSVLAGGSQVDSSYLPSVSVITLGELLLGVLAAANEHERGRRRARYEAVLANASLIVIGTSVAQAYAEIRHTTGRKPANDLWIAATAVAYRYPLLTADESLARLAGQIPGLKVIHVAGL